MDLRYSDADEAFRKEVRAFLEADVAKWATGKPRGDAYVVATAAALAVNDAVTTGTLHPTTKTALDKLLRAACVPSQSAKLERAKGFEPSTLTLAT